MPKAATYKIYVFAVPYTHLVQYVHLLICADVIVKTSDCGSTLNGHRWGKKGRGAEVAPGWVWNSARVRIGWRQGRPWVVLGWGWVSARVEQGNARVGWGSA